MTKRQDEVKALRGLMADYSRFLDRKNENINTDAFPVLSFALNKDKKSCSVTRQRGDFARVEKIEIPEYYEGKPATHIDGVHTRCLSPSACVAAEPPSIMYVQYTPVGRTCRALALL